MSGESGKYILVAVETDATLYHGENPSLPSLLNRNQSEQLLAHIASDLSALFPMISRLSLSMAGALYDQTQIMQPGYPVFESLQRLLASGATQQPRLLSVGAAEGQMPAKELQPNPETIPGILQILPLAISGDDDFAAEMFEQMEHRFMEEGQLSAHSAQSLEGAFGIKVLHARLMTLTDLSAMLRLQLEHFGFLPLWELLDAALNQLGDHLDVNGSQGQVFSWRNGQVFARFETFDFWANKGAGRELESDPSALASGYADWMREYRQYLVTLRAHEVSIAQYLAGEDSAPLDGSYIIESSSNQPTDSDEQITEHSSEVLGTIAVTLVSDGRQVNYYPILPEGSNDVHAHIRAQVTNGAVISFPGAIQINPDSRLLSADKKPDNA